MDSSRRMIIGFILLMPGERNSKEKRQIVELQLDLLRSPLVNYRMLRSNDTKIRVMTDKARASIPSLGQAMLQSLLYRIIIIAVCVVLHNPNTLGILQGDHAGHIFADRFGSSPELDNLVSQSKETNLKSFKALENKWDKAIKLGANTKIFVKYNPNDLRLPSSEISCQIGGYYP